MSQTGMNCLKNSKKNKHKYESIINPKLLRRKQRMPKQKQKSKRP